jgi:CheY-like chemotaxis protein
MVTERPRTTLAFAVRDTGTGIPADQLGAIFDPFKQVEAGKAAGGTGLGLAISRRLAEALGGRLDATSEVGAGSCFTLTLPLIEEAVAAAKPEAAAEPVGRVLAPGQHFTVLVTDDREANLDILDQLLRTAGFHTALARNGQEALNILRSRPIDLVLMDVHMPVMNGIEAVAAVRGDESLSAVPVVAVTASVFPEFRSKAIAAGFDDFLAKPIRADDLLVRLQRLLNAKFVAAPRDRAPSAPAPPYAHPLPAAAAERLRIHLAIRNITGVTALAAELAEDEATAEAGRYMAELAQAFDFNGLAALAETDPSEESTP